MGEPITDLPAKTGRKDSGAKRGARQSDAEAGAPASRTTLRPGDLKPGTPRAIRNEVTRAALLDAAASLVGELGYAGTSIARITERAGIAQGTFYNYFANRQEILDALLARLDDRMLEHIRERVRGIDDAVARERAQFKAFFEFLVKAPEFYRVLHEAEQFAPKAFALHHARIERKYERWLLGLRDEGRLAELDDRSVQVAAYILMAARDYLAMRYSFRDGQIQEVPDWVVDAYMTLLEKGLFAAPATTTEEGSGGKA